MFNPLISTPNARKGEPKVGGLVTVKLAGGKVSGGRLVRVAHTTYFVKLNGLTVPQPYKIGDTLPLKRDNIIDWQTQEPGFLQDPEYQKAYAYWH